MGTAQVAEADMLVSVSSERRDEVGVFGGQESMEGPGKMGHQRGNVGCKGKLFEHEGVRGVER